MSDPENVAGAPFEKSKPEHDALKSDKLDVHHAADVAVEKNENIGKELEIEKTAEVVIKKTLQEECEDFREFLVPMRVRYTQRIQTLDEKISKLECVLLKRKLSQQYSTKCVASQHSAVLDEELIQKCAANYRRHDQTVEKALALIKISRQMKNDLNHRRVTEPVNSKTLLRRIKRSRVHLPPS